MNDCLRGNGYSSTDALWTISSMPKRWSEKGVGGRTEARGKERRHCLVFFSGFAAHSASPAISYEAAKFAKMHLSYDPEVDVAWVIHYFGVIFTVGV